MSQTSLPTHETQIKFTNREQLQFFAELRKRINAYFKENDISQKANGAMVFKTVVMLSLYILPFIAMVIFAPPFWLSLVLWSVMGFALAGNGMSVMHDANHGAYSKNHKVNKWVGYTLNLLGGSVFNWKMQHNVLHHTYTNIAGKDDDIDGSLTMRFDPHHDVAKHHKHQWYYSFLFYGILTLYWGTFKDFLQFRKYQKEGYNKQSKKENALMWLKISLLKVGYFGVLFGLPMFVAGYAFWQVFLGFLIMNVLSGVILSVVFQLAHVVEETSFPLPNEAGEMEDSWAVHQLKTTSNFARHNKFLNWYVGGLNFQVEHHLFPNICHIHYPKLAPIVKKTAEEFGHPYLEHKSFGSALKSHVKMLRKFGTPPLDEIMA
ncbi:fatty acid desaturase family protein [Sanyastnella coralliicola]|uniref:fatty acid desaturase family protein n=1 Tax=Sanyastnella coralliicola TaxID=3069118 RepID=UPI0027B9EF56|nr:acyl-CoA desaturase [Longitalea sp. SCSIO 12813]